VKSEERGLHPLKRQQLGGATVLSRTRAAATTAANVPGATPLQPTAYMD
jgi:hypothetical protein